MDGSPTQASTGNALRAFARNTIEKQKPCYTIPSTIYDSLLSLLENYRSMAAVTVTVLYAFTTRSKRPPSEAMGVLARRAISLSDATIAQLGELLNAEEPKTAYSRALKNAQVDTIACRVFRKVIVANTFRTARSFLNTDDPNIEENQAAALLRLKHFARENDYRT